MRVPRPLGIGVAAVVFAAAACSSSSTATTTTSPSSADTFSPATLTVYSGRSESLIKPLLPELESAVGTRIQVRYGDSSELAAQILEEGTRTQADVFFSQDAGALGALADAGRLDPLLDAVTGKVLPGFADDEGRWVATSARARVVAYHPAQAPEAQSMTSIDAILDPRYRGRIGYAPTNASFHSFVTALRVAKGDEGARAWLTAFKANEPKAYGGNNAVLDGVDSGQVSLGLINHYYWHAKVAEKGPANVTARIRFLNADDPGALVNVAGVGVLQASTEKEQAGRTVEALLSSKSQQFFADQTAEYPVVAGVTSTKHQLPALASLQGSSIDLNKLSSLQQTLTMLREVGLT